MKASLSVSGLDGKSRQGLPLRAGFLQVPASGHQWSYRWNWKPSARTRRLIRWSPSMAAGAYLLMLLGFRSEPGGYVASYSLFHHHPADVMDFSSGIVTLKTCCGDENWGTYLRASDGRWIWSLNKNSKYLIDYFKTGKVVVEPGWLTMSFSGLDQPGSPTVLRRRVFQTLPF